jgi:hypothetical protein
MPRFPKDINDKTTRKGKGKDKKQFQRIRPAAPESDDDSSVDSRGNIRNLIDYDYSESESELFEMEDVPRRRAPRKAKTAAQKKIRKAIEKAAAQSDTSDSSYLPKKSRKPTLVITSSDDEEEEESEDERPVKAAGGAGAKAKKRRTPIVESSSDEDEEEESEEELSEVEEPKKKKKPVRRLDRRTKYVSESEEESEEDDDDEDDTDEEDEEDDSDYDSEEDSEEEDEPKKRRGAIDIVISDLFGGGSGKDPNKPKKYNLKKEPASVRRFVELVQKEDEGEEDTIDNDITYFKSLTKDRQSALLQVLEHKASPAEVQVPLKFKILEKVAVKPELNRIAMAKYTALCNLDPSSSEYYKCSHWISGFTSLPLGLYRDLPVKLEDGADKCHDFMSNVHKCMDRAIYGHEEPKLQIMQFVSSWIANPKAHGNVLSIHGPPGIGKTSLIKDGVAKALDRPFHFISLGGATDASYLDGHSYTYEGSTWGRIVEVLIQSKCMNPVIYFDELDKVSETPKGEEINNLLIHLTDGSQNDRFQDKYFTGIDLDLSRCLFIFSHNNIERVNPILRDRMYNIYCKGFSMKEKLLIAEEYLLPLALKESGLHEKISISKEILQHVIEHYTGGEAGVRELKRCLQTIVSKVNLLRFYNNPKQVPFAIEGFALPFTVRKSHIDIFLKRKEMIDESAAHMYI